MPAGEEGPNKECWLTQPERAERDRLKALPAEPDRWEEQLTGELYSDIYQALPVSERGAWLKSHGFTNHATKNEVSVIQGGVRGTAHLA